MLTNPSAVDVLAGVRESLLGEIMPEVQTDRARVLLAMIDTMLASVQKRIPVEQQWMADECGRMAAILGECAAAVDGEPSASATTLRDAAARLAAMPPLPTPPPSESISSAYRAASEAFTDAIGALNALEGEGVAAAPALLTRARAYLHLRAQRDMAALFAMDAGLVGRG